MTMKQPKGITAKTLTKSNVWDIQENDVIRIWDSLAKDPDLRDNLRHYLDIMRTAFEIERVQVDAPVVLDKYKAQGYKIATFKREDDKPEKWAIKKRPIIRVTDLTYENIRHISATKLLEVLDRNFGGGWESLSQSTQDIIESGFDISTTTLPKDRLHKSGGMYDKKVKDGFEVLEIPKGGWVEAIFAKEKPEMEKLHVTIEPENKDDNLDSTDDNRSATDSKGNGDNAGYNPDDDDDDFDEDKLTEESYRTTYETDPEDLNLEAEEVSDDDNDY